MKTNKFFDVFDKKRFFLVFRVLVLFVLSSISFNLFDIALSKYETEVTSSINADVAFFVITAGYETNVVSIADIVPSTTPYVYKFVVNNHKGNKRCDVDMSYQISFKTTTNLPLTYKLYKNEDYTLPGATNIISKEKNEKDSYGTYFKTLSVDDIERFSFTEDESDYYYLVVTYPIEAQSSPDKYQSVVEGISIIVDAKQIME